MSTFGALNASQVTLVNPQDPYLEIRLEKPGKILNTRLLVDQRARYQVATVDSQQMCTIIKDLSTNKIIATLQRKTFLSDTVTFPKRFGGKSVKKDNWIVAGKRENGGPQWTIQSESGRFVWRWDVEKRLVLAAENSPDYIIAYVKCEMPVFALMVRREAEHNLDEILLGFVMREHDLRVGAAQLDIAAGWASVQAIEVAL